MSTKPSWRNLAMQSDIVWRSFKISLFVGTILAMLNHGDKLILWQLNYIDVGKMLLTYAVPYCVSTYSSVQNELHRLKR